MDIPAINAIVQNDRLDIGLDMEYSAEYVPLIENYYNEIKTWYQTDAALCANRIVFRLATSPPIHQLDYNPAMLGDHVALIDFVHGILIHNYANETIEINFSPSMLLTSENGVSYVWSSQNFLALDVAHTIHNPASLTRFISLLRNFSLIDYKQQAENSMSMKYDEVLLFAISIHFYIRRRPQIVYGYTKSSYGQGLVDCCKETKKPNDSICFFKALSCSFRSQNGSFKFVSYTKKRTNLSLALKMKKSFIFWLQNDKKIKHAVFSKYGITTKGLLLAEQFFNLRVDIWTNQFTQMKKIEKNKAISKTKIYPYHIKTRKSSNLAPNTVNLLQINTDSSARKHLLAIRDPTFFSKKYLCPVCKIRFQQDWQLKRHLATDSHSRNKFVQNSPLQPNRENWKILEKLVPSSRLQTDDAFAFLSIQKEDKNTYRLDIHYHSNHFGSFSHSYKEQCLEKLANFTLNLLSKIGKPSTGYNAFHNVGFFCELEKSLPKAYPKLTPSNLSNPDALQDNGEIQAIRQYVIDRTCLIPVFISTTKNGHNFANLFLWQLLKVGLSVNNQQKVNFKTKLGNLTSLAITGKESNLQFLTVGRMATELYIDPELTFQDNVSAFKNLSAKIVRDFGVDIIKEKVTSLTRIAEIYFQNQLMFAKKFCVLSPSKTLYSHIAKSVRYGHLHAVPTVIQAQSSVAKSYIDFDFKKFYKSILAENQVFIGRAVHFEKDGLLFKPKNRLDHITFSNILFATLENLVEARLHYKLYGNEFKAVNEQFSHNTDCVLVAKDTTIACEYFGCFFHFCQNLTCHMAIQDQPKEHWRTCTICQNARAPGSKHKPSLWRMKSGETVKSLHPTRKIPYEAIAEESELMLDNLRASPQFDKVVKITECEIIRYWDKPAITFLQDYNLPVNKEAKNLSQKLGNLVEATVVEKFALFNPKHKLTTHRVLNLVRENKLFGLLVISGKCGSKSKEILQDFLPFSHKDKNQKMVNSFEMECQLVTTSFLNYLLTNDKKGSLPDFIVTRVHEIFAYPAYDELPYQRPCQYLTRLLEENKNDKAYLPLLKAIPNFHIGNFAFNPNKGAKCVLVTKDDLFGLPQTKNIKKLEHVTGQFYMAYFNKNQQFKNVSQNNLAVIQQGRLELLKFYVQLVTFCDCTMKRSNTDGITVTSHKPFPPTYRTVPIHFLDHWLKDSLTSTELANYMAFKLHYFKQPGFCKKHRDLYLCLLENKIRFYPEKCCIEYSQEDEIQLEMKIEHFGEQALITGINQMCSWQYDTNAINIKCSGLKNQTIDSFLSFTKTTLPENVLK